MPDRSYLRIPRKNTLLSQIHVLELFHNVLYLSYWLCIGYIFISSASNLRVEL